MSDEQEKQLPVTNQLAEELLNLATQLLGNDSDSAELVVGGVVAPEALAEGAESDRVRMKIGITVLNVAVGDEPFEDLGEEPAGPAIH